MLHTDQEQWQFTRVRAAQMRIAPTPAERKAWELLRGLGFKNQVPIKVLKHRSVASFKYYILDLYHAGARLCVELDGSVHRKTRGRDGRRDRALAYLGIKTLRFSNSDVMRKPSEFAARIASEIVMRGKAHE